MTHWQKILRASITSPTQLAKHFNLDASGLDKVCTRYPMRINPYYLSLIKKVGDPLWLQAVPDLRELDDQTCFDDPLNEENLSPAPNLVHKYPDRALFLVASQCAMYCRFCTRKRKVGTEQMTVSDTTIEAGLAYLRKTPAIRDVLVSGGDPLLLSDDRLDWILASLREIPSVEIIRIGTRVPCTLPMRVTTKLTAILKKYHPLYINTHFNHPAEITPEATRAATRLANAGIPLGCQTVLLRGVNDNPATMRELMHKLLQIRIKPYYLFQADMSRGTNHLRTPVATGIEIMKSLIGHTSGLATPTFAVDLPGGGGKVPLSPEYIQNSSGNQLNLHNYQGHPYTYIDAG
ncbi:MAG: KamA family radical SAM protein [Desulfobulbaceae bacterium]|nr:KamA family radical SAM protein [Desulfobulbaceae bacterium]